MRRRAIISLTPLIDVVFILLVFFMLATSFMESRVLDLDIKKSGGAGSMTGAMLVELRKDSLRLSGHLLSEDALLNKLGARFNEMPDQKVLIKPEAGVPLQRAVDLIDHIAAKGGQDVSFVSGTGNR